MLIFIKLYIQSLVCFYLLLNCFIPNSDLYFQHLSLLIILEYCQIGREWTLFLFKCNIIVYTHDVTQYNFFVPCF